MYNFLLFIFKITIFRFFSKDKQYFVINTSFNNKFIESLLII